MRVELRMESEETEGELEMNCVRCENRQASVTEAIDAVRSEGVC